MRNINWMWLWGSVLFAFSGIALAGELATVNELGHFNVQKNNVEMVELNGPKLQSSQITGTISAYDEVSERMSVSGAGGAPMEFRLSSNTPITDHNLQIKFTDLHLGDHVIVHYNVESRTVNAIEKL
jgi:hypothetical protein